jgi:hypothetical protein
VRSGYKTVTTKIKVAIMAMTGPVILGRRFFCPGRGVANAMSLWSMQLDSHD